MIPGSEYAFGTLVIVIFFLISLYFGAVIASKFEKRKHGVVTNGWICISICLTTIFCLMYATMPIYVSLFRWAATLTKGG